MLRTALLATALTVSLGACTTSSGVMNEATEAVGGVIDGAVAEARLAAAVSGPWRNPQVRKARKPQLPTTCMSGWSATAPPCAPISARRSG